MDDRHLKQLQSDLEKYVVWEELVVYKRKNTELCITECEGKTAESQQSHMNPSSLKIYIRTYEKLQPR